MADLLEAMQSHYALVKSWTGSRAGSGIVEFERTAAVIGRTLPPPPARIADIGGGPGRYTDWLVAAGYEVIHRDLVQLHVDQVRARHAGIDAAIGDARALDLADDSVDVVLMLGPLYHLVDEADRVQALREAGRIVRPGGVVHAAAISRWAVRLDGLLVHRLDKVYPMFPEWADAVERDAVMEPVFDGSFCGYTHTPDELRDEVVAAGLLMESLVSVEGIAFALGDLEERLAEPADRELLFRTLATLESVPELLGVGPHMLATARPR